MAKRNETKTCAIWIVKTRKNSYHHAAASREDAIAKTGEKASAIISAEICTMNPGPFATMRELREATCAHEWEETFGDDEDEDRFDYYGCPHCGASKRSRRERY